MDKNQETRVGGRKVKKNALLQLSPEPPNVPLVDSPGGSVVKKLPANQCRRHGFNPWSGKIPDAAEQLSLCITAIKLCSGARKPQLLKPAP